MKKKINNYEYPLPLDNNTMICKHFFDYCIDSQMEILDTLYLDASKGMMKEIQFDFFNIFGLYYNFIYQFNDLIDQFDGLSCTKKTTIRVIFLEKLKTYLKNHSEKNSPENRFEYLNTIYGQTEIEKYLKIKNNGKGAPYTFIKEYNKMIVTKRYDFIRNFLDNYPNIEAMYLETNQIQSMLNDNLIITKLLCEDEEDQLLRNYYDILYPYEKAMFFDEFLSEIYSSLKLNIKSNNYNNDNIHELKLNIILNN